MNIFIYCTIIAFLVLLRIVFAFTMKKSKTGDTHWHFLRYRYLKQFPWYKIDYTIPELIGNPTYGYPVLLHKILGWFPTDNFTIAAFALNIGFDLVFLLLAQGFYCVISGAEFLSMESISYLMILGTSAIYFPTTARLHAFGNSRILGLMTGSASVGLFILAQTGHSPMLLPFALVCYLLTLYASQFAFQALYLFFPLFLIFNFTLFTLLFSLLPVLLLALPSARVIILQQLDANRWRKQISKKSAFMNLRNQPLQFIRKWRQSGSKKPELIQFILTSFTPSIVLISAPLCILFLLNFIERPQLWQDNTLSLLNAAIWSYLVIVVLTSTKWLSTLGESERYVEFAMPFIVAVCLLIYSNDQPFILFFLCLNLLGIMVLFIFKNLGLYGYFFEKVNNEDTENQALTTYLNTLPPAHILTLPIRMWMSLARTIPEHKFYFYKSGDDPSFIKSLNYINQDNASLPSKLINLCQDLDIRLIIVDIQEFASWPAEVNEDLAKLNAREIFKSRNYSVIQLSGKGFTEA